MSIQSELYPQCLTVLGDGPYHILGQIRWKISLHFNIHTRKTEFLPTAEHPSYGSLDLCLILDGSVDMAKAEIERKGYPIELGPVRRHGARGAMRSIYLRDPDGNLVELAEYHE